MRVAGFQANVVLRKVAGRLKRREDKARKSAGTRELPMVECGGDRYGSSIEGRGV